MDDIWGEIKKQFKYGNWLIRLLLINVGVFLVIKILDLFSFLSAQPSWGSIFVNFLALKASFKGFLFSPWGIFTYMFVHQGFWHLLFNLLWFYWFGIIFLRFLDEKKLFRLYILGGVGGGLIFMLAYNFLPVFKPSLPYAIIIGASASVLAIVVAISAYVPDYVVYVFLIGPVKIKYIAIVSIILDILMIPYGANAGGHIAHLGGAIIGYVFAMNIKKGKDITNFFNIKLKRRRFPKMNVTKNRYRVRDDWEYNRIKKEDNERLDAILDKIAKKGYDSLTDEEKKFLFENSKRN